MSKAEPGTGSSLRPAYAATRAQLGIVAVLLAALGDQSRTSDVGSGRLPRGRSPNPVAVRPGSTSEAPIVILAHRDSAAAGGARAIDPVAWFDMSKWTHHKLLVVDGTIGTPALDFQSQPR